MENKAAPTIIISANGPVIVKGYFSFRDSSGQITEKEQEVHLCGCGKSGNKPFCDKSHSKL
jgi:CDGSH-type Zn-finger protein